MNPNFSIHIRRIFLTKLVIFLFISITLLVVDKNSPLLKPFRYYASFIILPVEQTLSFPKDIFAYLRDLLTTKQQFLTQNQILQTENALLKASAKQYIALELEVMRLREMLNASYEIDSNRLLIAEVLSVNNSLSKKSILIDKGSTNDVYLGQPVLDDKGVMGQIIEVKPMSALVLLISDFQNFTPVMLKKSGKRFLARGNREHLIINNVQSIQEIVVGDELVTSGLSGLYPAGYPVAIVSEIIAPDDGVETYSLKAKAVAGLNESQEVILVWSGDKNKNLYQRADEITTSLNQNLKKTSQENELNEALIPNSTTLDKALITNHTTIEEVINE